MDLFSDHLNTLCIFNGWMSVALLLFVATLESQPGSRSNGDEEQGRAHPAGDKESLMDQEKLHSLKLLLLDELLLHLPKLKEVGGVQAIPFMQVCHTFDTLCDLKYNNYK